MLDPLNPPIEKDFFHVNTVGKLRAQLETLVEQGKITNDDRWCTTEEDGGITILTTPLITITPL